MSTSSGPWHYRPEEISLPDGFAVEDLGWLTFAWTLKLSTAERGDSYTQIILGPGMLIEAHSVEPSTIDPFFPGCEEWLRHSVQFRERRDQNMLDWANYRTETMEWDGYKIISYKIISELLMCDFSESALYDQFAFKERTRQGRFVETLGDVVDTHPDKIKSVLAHIASVRLKKVLGM